MRRETTDERRRNIAAGFQEAVVDILTEKAIKACRLKKAKQLVLGGGVVANQRLREVLTKQAKAEGLEVYFPQSELCQDNAAMVAGLGYHLYRKGMTSNLNLEAVSNLA